MTPELTEKAEAFLLKFEPTPTNQICECAGYRICVYHQAADLVRELLALTATSSPQSQPLAPVPHQETGPSHKG